MSKPVTLTEVHPHRVTTLRHHAHLVRADRPAVPLDLELHYTALDPFAVRIVLRTDGASVRWSLSREALLLGLRRHEGIGDVAVWPVHPPGTPGRLCIRLGPLRACAVVQAEWDVISDWLDVTLQLVPADTESGHLQWEDFLAPLLGQEGP
ncbi:SsgA family sporulation/cell division regulator [Streptomyces sp. Ag109_O5-10]|uniref:SsgA family sporulation/cell division regulator n=1 Tax=Streptomyces sp. Ag109_O5-10 TaxID=1855349 RepID=UPI00089D3F80|nr:SsgA family sporulation/cell division regulator [Streptomyces sp. Ag109_O5-10]SEF15959.1 Streptomyces sporulation and cell division protein, SsgA [Streptomyces sp. Ag109_O5-10]